MNSVQIRERIASFGRWHYEFDLKGEKTPVWQGPNNDGGEGQNNRHAQRKKYFLDRLVEICGGSLKGKRVLDLGCNAGFWSLCAIEAGADYVYGVDGRQFHIDQSNFVFECKEIARSRYDFAVADVYDHEALAKNGPYDIVLNLGLMYHVADPIGLIDSVSRVNSDIMVIDTNNELGEEAIFNLKVEETDEPRNAITQCMVLVPTVPALNKVCSVAGYDGIVLEPKFSDWNWCQDFQKGKRRAWICAKKTDLSKVTREVERRFERVKNKIK